jgi:uncharacterized protein (DUF1697 family)
MPCAASIHGGFRMNRYVALLRAINVGGRNVKMDVLRDVFVQLGYHGVDTHLASGNVLFDSNANSLLAVRARIEIALQRTLGFEVASILRLQSELTEVAGRVLALQSKPGVVAANVGFFVEPPGAAGEVALKAFRSEIDDFELVGRELYWSCAKKQSESGFDSGKLERALKIPVTFRGANTVVQLAAKPRPA